MPSIFIWKSDKKVNNTIRVYSGSNWVLEEGPLQSYLLLEQVLLDDVTVFNIKKMPFDWVGSQLLKMEDTPYELIKRDDYGTLEQIGDSMRFTSSKEFNRETIETDFILIKSLI